MAPPETSAPAAAYTASPSFAAPLSAGDQAKVDAYLTREATRQRLQDYFDAPGENAAIAADIWREIEQLEAEGRIVGFEAMHMKLSWLALNSGDEAAYEQEAAALVEEYVKRDRAARAAFKPEDIPGYSDYKSREAEIIAEVNAMEEFPQGQTRQQYLRVRLLQARKEAYGETGEQAPPR
jgi:hypothetical protein